MQFLSLHFLGATLNSPRICFTKIQDYLDRIYGIITEVILMPIKFDRNGTGDQTYGS